MHDEFLTPPSATALDTWLQSPAGQVASDWERARFDASVSDLFGFHALQLGLPQWETLRANRMPHRWIAAHALDLEQSQNVYCDPAFLPFPDASLDLLVLPHTLEFCAEPHAVLREVERVLVPEGKLIISGFNSASLWAFAQARARLWRRLFNAKLFLPESGEFIAYLRLRDWLRLLSFDVESVQFGVHRPAFRSAKWLARTAWFDAVGAKSWPVFGAVYFVVATKRVRGMRMISTKFGKPKLVNAPVSVANKAHFTLGYALKTSESPDDR
jgi:SAM-dependent methyltransferase